MRDSAIFGRAFLDGFTMTGLLTKVNRPGAQDLQKLVADPSAGLENVQTAARDDQRAFRYAMSGLLTGAFAQIACIACYVYLVIHRHPVLAGIVLSIWVFGKIGDLIWRYLNRKRTAKA